MPPDEITQRGHALLESGFTPRRTVRRLAKEFPWAERLDVHIAAGLGPTGINRLWAEHGSLRPVIARMDPRPDHPPMHPVEVEGLDL